MCTGYCEVCGGVAVVAVRDITVIDRIDSLILEKRPRGKPHYFCAEHERESIQTNSSPVAGF